jgi:hypothetical protein
MRSGDAERAPVIVFTALATLCVAVASVASTLLVALGCIGDANTAQCRETKGGKVGLVEALLLFGPPVLVAIAGGVSVWRRRIAPILVATALLLPLAILLPPLAWE